MDIKRSSPSAKVARKRSEVASKARTNVGVEAGWERARGGARERLRVDARAALTPIRYALASYRADLVQAYSAENTHSFNTTSWNINVLHAITSQYSTAWIIGSSPGRAFERAMLAIAFWLTLSIIKIRTFVQKWALIACLYWDQATRKHPSCSSFAWYFPRNPLTWPRFTVRTFFERRSLSRHLIFYNATFLSVS